MMREEVLSITEESRQEIYTEMIKYLRSSEYPPSEQFSLFALLIESFGTGDNAAFFCREGFIDELPFTDRLLLGNVLNVLWVLLWKGVNIMTDTVIGSLQLIADVEPYKVLALIARYSQISKHTKALKVLCEKPSCFMNRCCIEDYFSLLVSLVYANQHFKGKWGKTSADIIGGFLGSKPREFNRSAFLALCKLADAEVDIPVLSESILVEQLNDPYASGAVLSYLLRKAPRGNAVPGVIPVLLSMAPASRKAAMVILSCAKNPKVAKILVDDPSWMARGMPSFGETLKLFSVILTHDDLLGAILEQSKAVISAFLGILRLDDPLIPKVIHTFIRRLPISGEFIQEMSESGFLSALFSYVGEGAPLKHIMLIISDLASIGYAKDYVSAIPLLSTALKTPQCFGAAIEAAKKLSIYNDCRVGMIEKRIDRLVFKKRKNPAVKSFLDSLNETPERERKKL